MKVTDEMVKAAMIALFSDGVPRIHWQEPVRNALEAAFALSQPVAEAVAWRVIKPCGLRRHMTQAQYDANPGVQKWYEPFKCASCRDAPAVAQPGDALKRIKAKLLQAGASLPAPENEGNAESSIKMGLSIALLLVEGELIDNDTTPRGTGEGA